MKALFSRPGLNTAMSGVNSSAVDSLVGNRCLASSEEQFQYYGQFTPSVSILLAVLMILMVLATVLGNALVILAFVVDKGLRTQGNFFFLNLAIADFLVGECLLPPWGSHIYILCTWSKYAAHLRASTHQFSIRTHQL